MLKEIVQALVVLVLAIPFIYMAYDVSKEIAANLYKYMNRKLKPVLIQTLNLTIHK